MQPKLMSHIRYHLFYPLAAALSAGVLTAADNASEENGPEPDIEATFAACGYSFKDLKVLNDRFGARNADPKEKPPSFAAEAKRLSERLEKNQETQTDMTIGAGNGAGITDFLLSYVVSEIRRYLSPQELINFNAVQKVWMDYRQKHATFVSDQYSGGSMESMAYSMAIKQTTHDRLQELEGILCEFRERLIPYAELYPSLKDD